MHIVCKSRQEIWSNGLIPNKGIFFDFGGGRKVRVVEYVAMNVRRWAANGPTIQTPRLLSHHS